MVFSLMARLTSYNDLPGFLARFFSMRTERISILDLELDHRHRYKAGGNEKVFASTIHNLLLLHNA